MPHQRNTETATKIYFLVSQERVRNLPTVLCVCALGQSLSPRLLQQERQRRGTGTAARLSRRRQIHVGVVNAQRCKCFEPECLLPVNSKN